MATRSMPHYIPVLIFLEFCIGKKLGTLAMNGMTAYLGSPIQPCSLMASDLKNMSCPGAASSDRSELRSRSQSNS